MGVLVSNPVKHICPILFPSHLIYIFKKIGALLFPNAHFLKSYQIKIDRGIECARPAHIPGVCACAGNG